MLSREPQQLLRTVEPRYHVSLGIECPSQLACPAAEIKYSRGRRNLSKEDFLQQREVLFPRLSPPMAAIHPCEFIVRRVPAHRIGAPAPRRRCRIAVEPLG